MKEKKENVSMSFLFNLILTLPSHFCKYHTAEVQGQSFMHKYLINLLFPNGPLLTPPSCKLDKSILLGKIHRCCYFKCKLCCPWPDAVWSRCTLFAIPEVQYYNTKRMISQLIQIKNNTSPYLRCPDIEVQFLYKLPVQTYKTKKVCVYMKSTMVNGERHLCIIILVLQ